MPTGHIGHNKFLVYEDSNGVVGAVLFGSYRLCTQINNLMIFDNQSLAERYRNYWEALKNDTFAAGGKKRALQGQAKRAPIILVKKR